MDREKIILDWAVIVDIFASEYGWTLSEIKQLDMGQIVTLLKTIRKRKQSQQGQAASDEPIPDMENKELSIADFKAMGGKERVREDGRTEIII